MLLVLNNRINLFFKPTRSPHVTESKTVLDSGSDSTTWIPDSRYWILSCCHWNLDSGLHSLVGFRISEVKFSGISESTFKAKISRITESRVPFTGRTLRRLACTQTLFYFSFRYLRKLLLRPRLPSRAGGQQIPHGFYFLSRALDELWRENRGSVNRLCEGGQTCFMDHATPCGLLG